MLRKTSAKKVSTDKTQVQTIVQAAVPGDATIFIGETRIKAQIEFVMLFGTNFDLLLKKRHAVHE